MSPELRELVVRQQRLLMVIWGAFIAATCVYAGIGAVLSRGAAVRSGAPPSLPVVVAIATSGLAIAAAGAAGGRRLLGHALQGGEVGAPRRRPLAAAGRELSEPERFLASRLPVYLSVMVITWASYEAAAVVGLVLTILTRDLVPAVAGSAVALALLAANRPQVEPFLEECGRWRRHDRGNGRRH